MPHRSICCCAIPPRHRICEEQLEVADKQAVLGKEPLPVSHVQVLLDCHKRPDMSTVNSSNAVIEEMEARIQGDLG